MRENESEMNVNLKKKLFIENILSEINSHVMRRREYYIGVIDIVCYLP